MPRHKGKLHQKALPLVAVHHLSGERNRVFTLHRRVFRQNEAAKIIRKRLDHAADNRQPPQRQLNRRAQLRQRRAPPTVRAVQIERAIRRHFLIDAHLHEQTAQNDGERVRDQHPVYRRNQTAHRNGNRLPPFARTRQRHDGVVHNILKRTVGDFVHRQCEHAAAVRRRARPAEGCEKV